MPTAAELVSRLESAFPGAEVQVKDLTGSGDQFEARVVCELFLGKSMQEQHQLVYHHLEPLVSQGLLHALALVTRAPTR